MLEIMVGGCYGNKPLFWITISETLIDSAMTFAGSCCTAAPESPGGRDQCDANRFASLPTQRDF